MCGYVIGETDFQREVLDALAGQGELLAKFQDVFFQWRGVKKEWDENFYDSVQAQKGYEMMRKCFSKKIKYLETDNKYLRNEDIIKQLKSNFLEAMNGEKK